MDTETEIHNKDTEPRGDDDHYQISQSLSVNGNAIGVFDSGSGGLITVAHLLRILKTIPDAPDVVYFGDTKHLPYGTKTPADVEKRVYNIVTDLRKHCSVVGVACHTASATSRRYHYYAPDIFRIIATSAHAAYNRAAVATDPRTGWRTKSIGVLATDLSVKLQTHAAELRHIHAEASGSEIPNDFADDVEVFSASAQELVADVDLHHVLSGDGSVRKEWRGLVRDQLRAAGEKIFAQSDISTMILGCTHFEFFADIARQLWPDLAARNGIICASESFAHELVDAWKTTNDSVVNQEIGRAPVGYFGFSGPRPPLETFAALGLDAPIWYDAL